MPTRMLRSNTIANIADFGAQSPGVAATNAQALRDALDVSRRIVIPAGIWNMAEILYGGDPWLPPEVEIFGEGSTQTTICYAPVDPTIPLFWFHTGGSGSARSTIRDLRLQGPVVPDINVPAVGIGISFDQALYARVRDVSLWYFELGVEFSRGVGGYSGYNVLERFEINACQTGIRARDATNGDTIQNGRVFYSLYQKSETAGVISGEAGIGIDIEGTTSSSGPAGSSGLLVQGVQVETAAICVRVVNAHQTTISGGYFETGVRPAYLPRRRIYEIAGSTSLVLQGNTESEDGAGSLSDDMLTPSYFDVAPEDRSIFTGTSIQNASDLGSFVTGQGAARSGATAPYANRIRNPDMSRGAMGWTSSGAIIVTPGRTPFITGGASLGLQVSASPAEHVAQDVTVDTGVRAVTVGVRYQLGKGARAFRVELHDLDAGMRLAHHTDRESMPGVWRVRTLTGRFDQLGPGLVGPRRLQVRLYPYNAPTALANQEVLVDSVWLVDGEYGPPFRHYTEGHELLRGDDRETFFSGVTSVDLGPVAQLPTRVPANALGMVVEVQVAGTLAGTHPTMLRIDDGEGSSPIREVFALVDDRPTLVEYTLPVTPGAPPQWSVQTSNPANTVTYAVRLKRWMLRL